MRAQPKHEAVAPSPSEPKPRVLLPLDAPEAATTGNPVHRYHNDLASRFGESAELAARARFAPSAILTVPLAAAGTVALVPIAIAAAVAGRIGKPRRGSVGGDVAAAVGSLGLAFRATAAALSTRRVPAPR